MSREQKKHKHAANLSMILNELRKTSLEGGLTLKELAELCGVSKRNVYRYLNEIENMGFELVRPIQTKPGQAGQGKYRLRRKTLPENRLDTNLMMILGLVAQGQLQYHEHLKVVNEFFIRYLAAKYQLSLPVNWLPPTETSEICTTNKKRNIGGFTLNKKKRCEIVKVVIGPSAAEVFQQEQFDFHVIRQEKLSDGSLLLTLGVYNSNDVLSWVFKWGEEAEIIEPRRLRKKMTDLCNTITKAYSSKYLSKKISYLQTIDIS